MSIPFQFPERGRGGGGVFLGGGVGFSIVLVGGGYEIML